MVDCRTGAENTQDEPGAPSSARKKGFNKTKIKETPNGDILKGHRRKNIHTNVNIWLKKMKKRQVSHIKEFLITFVDNRP